MSSAYHLNLLMESEHVSSSPVRFRVMMPVLAIFLCVGLAIWWAILGGQLMLARANIGQVTGAMKAGSAAHRAALANKNRLGELEAQLAQLDCFRSSIRRRGDMLTALAESMPLKVQLQNLSIPMPPQPVLNLPPAIAARMNQRGPKIDVSMYGPTAYVERASLVLTGRSTKEVPILSLMDSLSAEAFTNDVIIARQAASPAEQSPKIRSFRQDASRASDGSRLVAFEIEYRLTGRRFAQ